MTSKTRRRYSVRGSQAAPSGAPLGSRKKSILKRQMVVTDEGEISMMEAVKNLREAEKTL